MFLQPRTSKGKLATKKALYVILLSALIFSPGCLAVEKEQVKPRSSRAGELVKLLKQFSVHKDINYVEKPTSMSQKLDLYIPKNSGDKLPALVVWIHGGGWKAGDKRPGPYLQLMKAKFAVASINYRLSQEANFPAQIHDCKSAIIWLKKNAKRYNYDASRLGVWGASAGGHLCALLQATTGTDKLEKVPESDVYNSDVTAMCDWFGPSDLLRLVRYNKKEKLYNVHPMVSGLLGVTGPRMVDAARQASPVTYIDKAGPPTLIIHGDSDKLVPLDQSQLLYEKLKSQDCDVSLDVIEGGGHGFPGFGAKTRAKVVQFFQKTLN